MDRLVAIEDLIALGSPGPEAEAIIERYGVEALLNPNIAPREKAGHPSAAPAPQPQKRKPCGCGKGLPKR